MNKFFARFIINKKIYAVNLRLIISSLDALLLLFLEQVLTVSINEHKTDLAIDEFKNLVGTNLFIN